MKYTTKVGLLGLISATTLGFASSAMATPVTYSYTTNIGFNPDETIGAGGANASQLVNELFGSGVIGSTGDATIHGSFSYNSNAPVFAKDSNSSVYSTALTGATVSLGANTAHANIDTIRNHKDSSRFGTIPSGSCADIDQCAKNYPGEPFTRTGTLIQLINDVTSTLSGKNGEEVVVSKRDTFSFALGDTDVQEDFSPVLSTPTFGDVYVDEVLLDSGSKDNRDFFNSLDLPDNVSFLNETNLKQSLFGIQFSGSNLPNGFALRGTLSQVGGSITAVPEPGSLSIMALGLTLLGFGVRKHRKG